MHVQVDGARAECLAHAREPALQYARGNTAPAGMKCGYRTLPLVDDENRYAVRNRDRQQQSSAIGDVSVGIVGEQDSRWNDRVVEHFGAMDLKRVSDCV